MNKMIKKIRILNREYKVKFPSEPNRDDGLCDSSNGIITIYPNGDDFNQRNTLYHEIGHCYIFETAKNNIPEKYQEEFCNLFAIALEDMESGGYIKVNL